MKKRKYRKYQEELTETLKDPGKAAMYLTTAFEEGDRELFLLAVKDVAQAYGGMSKLSKRTKLNRESLYRMLSKKGNPELYSLHQILHVLGIKISFQAENFIAA